MDSTEAVSFPNRRGEQLLGILHRPSYERYRGAGVVLLSPGIKSRVAPHRLYVKLARRLCAKGFLVLRFDFHGLGDSQGEVNERLVADLYGSIQAGRYRDDTLAAIDWLQRTQDVHEVALTGLCGGAVTGLFAGAHDARVRVLVGFGIPVMLDGSHAQRTQFLTGNELEYFGKKYLRRLKSVKSWVRLLTFQSNYKVIARSLKVYARKVLRMNGSEDVAGASPKAPAGYMGNVNPHFAPAFLSMLSSGRSVYLAFGELDRLHWQYREKFYRLHAETISKAPGYYELYLVKGARHIFEEPSQQDELFMRVEAWLEEEFAHRDSSERLRSRVRA